MRDIYLLTFTTVLCHSAASGGRIAASLFAIDLGASPLTVGAVMGVYGVLPMALSVAAGRLSDRIGARVPMIAGTLALAIGLLLVYAWPRIGTLYASSCLIGCGFMLFNIAMQNVSGRMGPPERRAANLSVIALGFSFSTLIGPSFSGVAIDAVGHRNTFLLLSLFPIVPAGLLAFNAIDLPRMPRAQRENKRVLELLRNKTLFRVFVVTTLLATAWELYGFVVPVYGASIGLSATAIGLVMGSFSGAIIVVRLVLPFLAKRLDAWRLVTSILVYAGALFFLFPLAHTAVMLAVLSFLLGLGLGIPQPLVVMLLHSYAPPGRVGEAIGLRQASIYATQTFMPMAFGAVGAALGMGPVFWAIALGLAAGGIYARQRPAAARVESATRL